MERRKWARVEIANGVRKLSGAMVRTLSMKVCPHVSVQRGATM
jgi:hypothetical protein